MQLIRISVENAHELWEMQVKSFQEIYQKYQDYDTNPAVENLNRVVERLQQPSTYYYYIYENNTNVGAIRVVDEGQKEMPKRIAPLFIMPQYRNQGIAQKAIRAVEEIHGSSNWELSTILQEAGNCYLYEKMGYRQTGVPKIINDKMTLVFYNK